jgi:hypothetical protein
MKPLRIYTRTEIIPPDRKPVFLLWPALGISETDANDPDYGRFAELFKNAAQIVQLVSIEEAEVVVLPFEYNPADPQENTVKLAKEAAKFEKPFVVFYNSDFDDEIKLPGNVHVFRTTAYRSSRGMNVHGYPGWSLDFLHESRGKFTPLPKEEKPRISYCGYVDYSNFSERMKYALRRGKTEEMYRRGPELRGKAVRRLLANPEIETDFVIRRGFWAAGIPDKKQARKEYRQNMLASPYALVARGAGNFSYRLYEALSCGRIPVFIDSDCVLPFDEFIDWKKQVLWIDRQDVNRVDELLLDFHRSLSPGEFEEKQVWSRQLYEEWISPKAFFTRISMYFRTP